MLSFDPARDYLPALQEIRDALSTSTTQRAAYLAVAAACESLQEQTPDSEPEHPEPLQWRPNRQPTGYRADRGEYSLHIYPCTAGAAWVIRTGSDNATAIDVLASNAPTVDAAKAAAERAVRDLQVEDPLVLRWVRNDHGELEARHGSYYLRVQRSGPEAAWIIRDLTHGRTRTLIERTDLDIPAAKRRAALYLQDLLPAEQETHNV